MADALHLPRPLLPQVGTQKWKKGRAVCVHFAPSILPDRQVGPIDSSLGLVRSRRTAVARPKCCSNRLSSR